MLRYFLLFFMYISYANVYLNIDKNILGGGYTKIDV